MTADKEPPGNVGRAKFAAERSRLHRDAGKLLIRRDEWGVPDFADRQSPAQKKKRKKFKLTASEEISLAMIQKEGLPGETGKALEGQGKGRVFEELIMDFVKRCFISLPHVRPGKWYLKRKQSDSDKRTTQISQFEQYEHLGVIDRATADLKEIPDAVALTKDLETVLGSGYLVKPDIVVFRDQLSDAEINENERLVDDDTALLSSLRASGPATRLLHASVSCKYTLRSDRSQNARTEALNLLRNRKGRAPHIVVVTAEPLPSRIASLALGSGDIDCVYHFALYELQRSINRLARQQTGYQDSQELLNNMVEGKRLRDISDLPLDLAV